MLVHICCSVDSHFFIEKLQADFPDEKLVGFFYDPNIHPYSEYLLRLEDARYSCEILGVELFEGEYDLQNWLEKVRGLENEPEKGERCTVCFDDRLEVSAQKALALGHTRFTTTLLVSPKKSQEKLEKIGNTLATKYNIEFIFRDYRSGNGGVLQSQAVKENKLYRQDYCGCMFALSHQRAYQERLLDELMSPITRQILPNSIEDRLALYRKRDANTVFVKDAFMNYRLLFGYMMHEKRVIPSYFLSFSHLKKKSSKFSIETQKDGISYANKDAIIVVDIVLFNYFTKSHFKNTTELYFCGLDFEMECELREKITKSRYNISPIIVVDEVKHGTYEVYIESKIYEDVKIQTL